MKGTGGSSEFSSPAPADDPVIAGIGQSLAGGGKAGGSFPVFSSLYDAMSIG